MVDSWQKLISFIKTDSAFSILDNLKQFEDNNADGALDYMLSGHHALYGFTTVSVVLQLRSSDADFGITRTRSLMRRRRTISSRRIHTAILS